MSKSWRDSKVGLNVEKRVAKSHGIEGKDLHITTIAKAIVEVMKIENKAELALIDDELIRLDGLIKQVKLLREQRVLKHAETLKLLARPPITAEHKKSFLVLLNKAKAKYPDGEVVPEYFKNKEDHAKFMLNFSGDLSQWVHAGFLKQSEQLKLLPVLTAQYLRNRASVGDRASYYRILGAAQRAKFGIKVKGSIPLDPSYDCAESKVQNTQH